MKKPDDDSDYGNIIFPKPAVNHPVSQKIILRL